MPRISVVIPTRNRATLVRNTVLHTLGLSYKDMELVVIDNDDTDATGQALAAIDDARLRVVRTGGLAMPENWEEGFKAAGGDYIYMQSDRLHLIEGMLEYVAERIERYQPEVIKCAQGRLSPQVEQLEREDGWSILDPKWIISFILNSDIASMYNLIPNGYSTFYSKPLVRSIQAKYGAMAARVTPDFTAAYSTLFSVKALHHSKRQLYEQQIHFSTGMSFQYGGDLGNSCLKKIGITLDEMIQHTKVPVKSIPLNTIFSDFFAIAKKMNQSYTLDDLDDINYFNFLFRQLMVSKYYYHIDVTDDLRRVYNFLEEKELIGHPRVNAIFEEFNLCNTSRAIRLKFLDNWQLLARQEVKLAIYGASAFTSWLEQATQHALQPEIVAVLDIREGGAPVYFGHTAIAPRDFDPSTSQMILISSEMPATVYSMVSECRRYFGESVRLLFIDSSVKDCIIRTAE